MIAPNKRGLRSSLSEKEQEQKRGADCRASRRQWKAVSWWGSLEDKTWSSSQAGVVATVSDSRVERQRLICIWGWRWWWLGDRQLRGDTVILPGRMKDRGWSGGVGGGGGRDSGQLPGILLSEGKWGRENMSSSVSQVFIWVPGLSSLPVGWMFAFGLKKAEPEMWIWEPVAEEMTWSCEQEEAPSGCSPNIEWRPVLSPVGQFGYHQATGQLGIWQSCVELRLGSC